MVAESTQRLGILLVLFGFFLRTFETPGTRRAFLLVTSFGFPIAGGGLIAHLYSVSDEELPPDRH